MSAEIVQSPGTVRAPEIPAAIGPKSRAVPEVVDALRRMLAMAEAGEIAAIAAGVVGPYGTSAVVITGEDYCAAGITAVVSDLQFEVSHARAEMRAEMNADDEGGEQSPPPADQ